MCPSACCFISLPLKSQEPQNQVWEFSKVCWVLSNGSSQASLNPVAAASLGLEAHSLTRSHSRYQSGIFLCFSCCLPVPPLQPLLHTLLKWKSLLSSILCPLCGGLHMECPWTLHAPAPDTPSITRSFPVVLVGSPILPWTFSTLWKDVCTTVGSAPLSWLLQSLFAW